MISIRSHVDGGLAIEKETIIALVSFSHFLFSEIRSKMVHIADHVIRQVNECLVKHAFPVLDENQQHSIKGQFVEVVGNNHPVHKIISEYDQHFTFPLLYIFLGNLVFLACMGWFRAIQQVFQWLNLKVGCFPCMHGLV
jgi:hypothetical protein